MGGNKEEGAQTFLSSAHGQVKRQWAPEKIGN